MARKTQKLPPITKQQWQHVRHENKSVLSDFLIYCKSIDLSPKTIHGYESDLRIAMVWIAENLENKAFFDIQKRD
ncbi:hypothetical protein, partial [Enterococcus faecium]|uniref:hypothetical protein n=1 Tax=Enterococcus faecium TaxID=1352 RepID=UPI003DA1BCB3